MVLPFVMEPLEAASPRTAECLLPATGPGVAAARALVRRELPLWGARSLVDDCELIVGELAANVVRHGGSAFTLRLAGDGRLVRGEVFDPGEGVPRPRACGPDATGGRGLLIVGGLALDWGVRPGRYGKTVWFVVGDADPAPGHPVLRDRFPLADRTRPRALGLP
ncbi:ATP-binding protein [Microtetraspora niveoalba]|uniref:ATP-binding protein n=1 Tax=Microtetraspora niveoalba TaxID=46175 RepID=UPI00082A4F09|nr:ATP-binding protein [Microtetraspora niveoalba]